MMRKREKVKKIERIEKTWERNEAYEAGRMQQKRRRYDRISMIED